MEVFRAAGLVPKKGTASDLLRMMGRVRGVRIKERKEAPE